MPSSINLGEQVEGCVSELVNSGRHNAHSQITLLASLDAGVQRGIADADDGRVHDLDAVLEDLNQRYAAKAG